MVRPDVWAVGEQFVTVRVGHVRPRPIEHMLPRRRRARPRVRGRLAVRPEASSTARGADGAQIDRLDPPGRPDRGAAAVPIHRAERLHVDLLPGRPTRGRTGRPQPASARPGPPRSVDDICDDPIRVAIGEFGNPRSARAGRYAGGAQDPTGLAPTPSGVPSAGVSVPQAVSLIVVDPADDVRDRELPSGRELLFFGSSARSGDRARPPSFR